MTTGRSDPRRGDQNDAVDAFRDLGRRSGAVEVAFGWKRDRSPYRNAGWYAYLVYAGRNVIEVRDALSPEEACDVAAKRVLYGANCTGCDKVTVLEGQPDIPIGRPGMTVNGRPISHTEESLARWGMCTWGRSGARWNRECGDEAPTGSTREALARALARMGARSAQIAAARAGRYDGHLSTLDDPRRVLLAELEPYGEWAAPLIARVEAGEFDASPGEMPGEARADGGGRGWRGPQRLDEALRQAIREEL